MDEELSNYIKELENNKLLSIEKQKEYLIKYKKKNDREAFLELFNSNLRLVVAIAKQYFKYNLSLSAMDLIQEGNLGLIKAIEKYDIKKIDEVKLSTYATHWIKSYIDRAIYNDAYLIRIPVSKFFEIKKYKKVFEEFVEKNHREPTVDELSNILKISKQNVSLLPFAINTIGIGSLNSLIIESKNTELLDFFSDETNILNDIVINEQKEFIQKELLSKLTKKQYEVIYYLYGFDGSEKRGYQEVARLLNVKDRRNIYELEKKALIKIRETLEKYKIEDYGIYRRDYVK